MSWRLLSCILFALAFLLPTASYADEISKFTEFSCDANSNSLTIRNRTFIDGSPKVKDVETLENSHRIESAVNLELHDNGHFGQVSNPENILATLETCQLIDALHQKPVKIDIKRTDFFFYSQGQCGAVSGAEYDIILNDKRVVIWPSFHNRCLGHFSNVDDDDQIKAINYIRISGYGVKTCADIQQTTCRYISLSGFISA